MLLYQCLRELFSDQIKCFFLSWLVWGGWELWKDKAIIDYGHKYIFFLPSADRKEKMIVAFVDNKEAFFSGLRMFFFRFSVDTFMFENIWCLSASLFGRIWSTCRINSCFHPPQISCKNPFGLFFRGGSRLLQALLASFACSSLTHKKIFSLTIPAAIGVVFSALLGRVSGLFSA